ncbi:YoaK family protein [Arcticibacter sp.]|uniref:YoaK family protein n=1 Tax=Arcticibacter sp. TaxID=1872630 RepID=UPI00388EC4DE
MFRHNGKGRTYLHNLKLASLLSCVAGIVNITGVLSLGVLTTNVTGHFAFFSEEFFLKDYRMACIYLVYTLFFLFGAFVSSTLMELALKFKHDTSYMFPIAVEIGVLLLVACSDLLGLTHWSMSRIFLSCALLFAMGLQNALVTTVSKSVVRTTHLTGLFTDLGIELSQLLFYKGVAERKKLHKAIFLKGAIISCFFSGGLIGGFTFLIIGQTALFIPVILLFFGLWYDRLLLRYYNVRRRFRHQSSPK